MIILFLKKKEFLFFRKRVLLRKERPSKKYFQNDIFSINKGILWQSFIHTLILIKCLLIKPKTHISTRKYYLQIE
jgi:hypothetical protein